MLARALLILLLLAWRIGHAGQICGEKPPTPEQLQKALRLALQVRETLDASSPEVALIARVGKDLSRYKLRYSHVGFAWRHHPKGRWMVVHQLNHCGTAHSEIYDEGLGNFFLDDMFAYESAIILLPTTEAAKIASLFRDGRERLFHERRYNMVAYPFSTRYQNSNQWLLEVFAAAVAERQIDERARAQTWLKYAGYEPITIQISALTRLGGRMATANVAFDDHPFARRMAGQIDTVSVESIERFVHKRYPDARTVHISLDDK